MVLALLNAHFQSPESSEPVCEDRPGQLYYGDELRCLFIRAYKHSLCLLRSGEQMHKYMHIIYSIMFVLVLHFIFL